MRRRIHTCHRRRRIHACNMRRRIPLASPPLPISNTRYCLVP
jgi:hypothetical protein